MSETISLDIDEFNLKMDELKSGVDQVKEVISKSETLDKTNIDPFVENLSIMIESLELLERYKSMVVSEDIPFMKKKVNDLVEQDEKLSVQIIDSKDGSQPAHV